MKGGAVLIADGLLELNEKREQADWTTTPSSPEPTR
jgi:hypothetical protein